MAHIEFDRSYMPCAFAIVADGCDCYDENPNNTLLIQADWDYPGVATAMGWIACNCGSTDGTVDCTKCGRTASEMIGEAYDFIESHQNEKFPALDDYLSS